MKPPVAFLRSLEQEIDGLLNEVRRRLEILDLMMQVYSKQDAASQPLAGRRPLSPAARRRIGQAQKKRWAKFRANKANGKAHAAVN